MESKTTKTNLKSNQKPKSIRINSEVQKKAERLLLSANKKKVGRKIKADQLRQRYIEMRGPISRDEFTGFMLTKEFSGFIAEHSQSANAA